MQHKTAKYNPDKYQLKGKNKSSKTAKPEQPKTKVPEGWFYMSARSITVADLRDMLADSGYDIEIWEAAGVLEVGIEEKLSVDIETLDTDLGDAFSNEFVAEHGIQSIFYLSFPSKEYPKCRPVLERLASCEGGMICGDTENFEPIMGLR